MAYTIFRIFSREPDELIKRPRVSHKISEYVFEYILSNLLIPHKLLKDDKNDYSITLSFAVYNEEMHKYFSSCIYNTEENKFSPDSKFKIYNNTKEGFTRVISSIISDKMTPTEYANLVYDMFGALLIEIYPKKISKEKMDELKGGLDHDYIQGFPFPAPFEEQQYTADNSSYFKSENFKTTTEKITIKDVYLNHFKF
jgi:hypothetical protein